MPSGAAVAENIEDPVELMLRQTGCIELHYKVQECIAETGDWRRCQDVVRNFKECMKKYTDQQTKNKMFMYSLKQTYVATRVPCPKLALVVRGDLKMSKGKTAAQCAHAAVICYQQSQMNESKQKLSDVWAHVGQPKIVLQVNTYDDMLNLKKRAEEIGVLTAIVHDAGRTQLEAGTPTVLGLGPDAVTDIDKLVSNLKLL